MAFGSKDKGRDNEDYFRKLADQDRTTKDAAVAVAAKPTEAGTRIERNALALDDWEHGIGPDGQAAPIDVHNLPAGGPMLEIYKQGQMMTDAGRQGRGLSSVTDGANPNFSAALDRESEDSRKLFAQGQLEDSVNRAIEGKNAALGYLDSSGTNKNLAIAGLQQSGYDSDSNRFLTYLMQRENRPSFLRTLTQSFGHTLGQTLGRGPTPTPVPAGA